MKVLLQNEETGLYYGGDNWWVAEKSEAMNLGTVDAGARKALECEGMSMSVVVSFEDSKCEMAINPVFCISGPVPPIASLTHFVLA
jgi:hypothetical protein